MCLPTVMRLEIVIEINHYPCQSQANFSLLFGSIDSSICAVKTVKAMSRLTRARAQLLAKCLLRYLVTNPNDFELLFQLLHVYDAIYVPSKKFLQDYIQHKVVEG